MKTKQVILTIGLGFLLSALLAIAIKWIQTGNPFQASTILVGAVTFINFLILGSFAHYLYHKYASQSTERLKKKVVPLFLLFALTALLLSLTLVGIGVYVFYRINDFSTSGFWAQLVYNEFPVAIRQFAFWIFVGSAFFFYLIWRQAVDREQDLREENLRQQYSNLKSQINPHFLFNSLNTLSEIVYESREKADRYIQKLSAIYRYVLDHEDEDLVPLKQELDFVQNYFNLQKERDHEKIQLKVNIQNPEAFAILPVSLQSLVENALKHNAKSEKTPLNIQIYLENESIVVENNLQKKDQWESTTKKGLENLNRRLKLMLKKELEIVEQDQAFIVKLPLVKAEK